MKKYCVFFRLVLVFSLLHWNLDLPLSAEPIISTSSQPIVKKLSDPQSIKPLVPGGDCGPRVLQKILAELGQDVTLKTLIDQTKTEKGQTRLDSLIQGTKQHGFWALGIKTDSNTLADLLKEGYFVIAHVGGNKHYVWIQEVSNKWIKGYNPAVRNEDWKLPRKVFDSLWKGEGMILWKPRLLDFQRVSLGQVLPLGFESKVELLNYSRLCQIWGGVSCINTNGLGGQHPGGCKTHEPVELANGDFVMATKDFSIPSLGPDLVLERLYHAQLFSDIEGWEPEPGTGSWSIENGKYAGSGDRSGTVDTWANLSVSLSMQTVEPGPEAYHVGWVNFRYQNENNRYYFLIKTDGTLELTKFKNGTQSFLASQSSSYDPADPHTLQIEANGSQIKVWVDSNLEINYTDSSNPLTGAGKVVLESHFSHAHYDDIQVIPLPSGTVKSWNFSQDDNDGMFGRGWRANIEMNLIFKNNDDIIVRQGNDRRDLFVWNSGTSTYTNPSGIYQSLTKVSTEYDLKDKRGTIYHFDADGYLETVTDRYGNTLTFSYTTVAGKKRVDEITDETGRTLSFTYDTGTGRCTQVTDPLNRTVTYTYNTNGLLETAEDPRGNTREYVYDEHYRMTGYTDRNGNLYQYEYSYNNRVVSQTDSENNITVFDYLWDVTQVTDAANNVWTYQFDENDALISQTDPQGNETTYDWDENYNLLSQTDPEGHITQYTYDSKGNRLTEEDALGKTTTWTYESTFNQVTSVTDKNGNSSTYTYDTSGNLTEIEDPLGFTITATYNAQGQMTSMTDKRGKTTDYTYDAHGYIDEVTDALDNITDYDYDVGGRLTQVTDALTHTTEYEYDENNNLTQVTDPLTHTISYTYDANGNRITVTDGLNHTATSTYNAYNKVQTVTDPLNRVTTYTYDPSRFMLTGEISFTQAEDPDQNITEYTRDKIGRMTALENALNHTTAYEYDGANNITQITDANNHVTQYDYDVVNRLIKTTYEDTSEEENIYDSNGNLIEKKLRDGKTISYFYNERNELIQRRVNTYDGIYLNNTTWTVGDTGDPWEGENFELRVSMQTVDPGTEDWHVSRINFRRIDADNLYYFLIKKSGGIELVRRKNAEQVWLYSEASSYDPTDLLFIRIEVNGNQIKVWINNNLEINVTDSDPVSGTGNIILEGHSSNDYFDNVQVKDLNTSTVEAWYSTIFDNYTYDENGNLTQITRNGTKTWTFIYDDLNRLTQTTDSENQTIQYEYDAIGRRTQLTYPDTTEITYTYDNANRLTQINEGTTTHVAYTYDNANRRTLRELTNGVDTTYTYDAANQLTSLATVKSSATFSSYSYTYDDLGNRTQQVDLAGTHTYQYDDISQLTQANYPGSVQQNYTYDPVHNRNTFSQSVTGTYTNNNINQVTQYLQGTTTTTYSWDDRGNIEQKLTPTTTITYTHNLLNQLITLEHTGQDTVSFEYDPLGRRIQKTVGSTTVKYTWSGDQLIEVRNDSGTLLRKFIYGTGIDEPILINNGSSNYYYTHDGLGSISEITGSTGAIAEKYTYDVYGKPSLFDSTGTPITSSTVDNPYYFTGREYDFETGLYYYRVRYYDPVLGRFLQTDPLGYVDSMNLYAYVVNNPWNRVDPTGMGGFLSWIDDNILQPVKNFFVGGDDEVSESELARQASSKDGDPFEGEQSETRNEAQGGRYFIVELGRRGPPIPVQEVTRDEAVSASRAGVDILAPDDFEAFDVALAAGGGGLPIHDNAHEATAGPGALPHYHPADIWGNKLLPSRHVFYPG